MWDPMPVTGPGSSCQRETDELRLGRALMTQGDVESTGHRYGQDTSGSPFTLGNMGMETGRRLVGNPVPETPRHCPTFATY